jgi:hypothetical protein
MRTFKLIASLLLGLALLGIQPVARAQSATFTTGYCGGFLLRAVSDGSGVRAGDRAAAYAVSELGKFYVPLPDKTKLVHHMAMGCLAYAKELIKQ